MNISTHQIDSGIVAELPADSLFQVDASGDAAIQKAYNKRNKPLRADEILAQRSAVPAVDSRKRKDPSSKVTNGILPVKRRREGGVSRKEYERLRGIAYGGDSVKKDVVKSGVVPMEDLWGDMGEAKPAPNLSAQEKFSFLEDKRPVKAPSTVNHKPITLLASGKAMPAVPKPVGGRSYNPSFEAWDALIQHEGDAEVARERQRLQELQEETEQAARVAKSAEEARRAEEEADESAWETEWEGFLSEREDHEGSGENWLKKKRPERKTKAERNKIQRRKEEERRKKHEAKLLEKKQQLIKVKELAKLSDDKRKARLAALAITAEDSTDDEYDMGNESLRKTKFGKYKIPEAPLELVLADELQDSLRALKPEGNLLQERFRSMQVRGKIEPRKVRTQQKKPKRKMTEKWSYKDWKLKY